MRRYDPKTFHDPETYIGFAVTLAAFAVATSVCSSIFTLALTF
jgi:hypothetical protein